MIQVLGFKRVMVLIVLVAINAAVGAATYLYAYPQKQSLERELNITRGQISDKRSQADRLRSDFNLIQQQKTYFENLKDAGFLSDQNRIVARRRIQDIQRYSKVIRANYGISAAKIEKNQFATDMDYAVLDSPIKIDVEALDDLDVYNFIFWMENAFPGHVSMRNFELERVLDINEATLRAIGAGQTTVLLKGTINFAWRTMVPKSEVSSSGDFGSEGF